MEIETPCRVCKRISDDKRACAADCPALMLYRQNSAVCFDKKKFDKINKELKNLADVHAGQFTEKHTDPAEMMPESDEEGGTFMADLIPPIKYKSNMEVEQDFSDELDIDETQEPSDEIVGADAFVQKPKNAGKQQEPSEEIMPKKRKYTKKKDIPTEDAVAQELVLDMSMYPQIARMLKAMSEETMLPQEHIVMSFIGKGFSRE
ncbi:hypothetical protein KAR91_75005 [Candidatus Pacearchaeota archaeon]|nr:hypothetical protein [Candidatus Pacearchaeota archaeon]